ncbi:hypothetical protein [Echinicola strongylocentroti]|nr:hypothetical protein [Echinicola strongylocentroti]
MKSIATLFIIFILLFGCRSAPRKLPQLIQEKENLCKTTFTEQQERQLRKELGGLEAYFIRKGLLKDSTGASYRAVYKKIARQGDLYFKIDTSFQLLDSLDWIVTSHCFYQVFTSEELSQIRPRHYRAAKKINAASQKAPTPGKTAKQILHQLKKEDFGFAYYKTSSLVLFYQIAWPYSDEHIEPLVYPSGLETMVIQLNKNSQITIDHAIMDMGDVRQKVYNFLKTHPETKGIEISSNRNTSYKSYLQVKEVVKEVYAELSTTMGRPLPKYIIIHEPK